MEKYVVYEGRNSIYHYGKFTIVETRDDGVFYHGLFYDGIIGTSFAHNKDVFDNESDAKSKVNLLMEQN